MTPQRCISPNIWHMLIFMGKTSVWKKRNAVNNVWINETVIQSDYGFSQYESFSLIQDTHSFSHFLSNMLHMASEGHFAIRENTSNLISFTRAVFCPLYTQNDAYNQSLPVSVFMECRHNSKETLEKCGSAYIVPQLPVIIVKRFDRCANETPSWIPQLSGYFYCSQLSLTSYVKLACKLKIAL